MRRLTLGFVFLALAVTSGGYVLADADPPEPNGKMVGDVIGLREQVRTENQGEVTQIQIRDRNRREMWLQLGPSEQFGDAVRVGDRVRVRVMSQGDGGPAQIKRMHNYRSGERIRVCDGSGAMVQQRQQLRDGSGTGSGNRYGATGAPGQGQRGANGGAGGSCRRGR